MKKNQKGSSLILIVLLILIIIVAVGIYTMLQNTTNEEIIESYYKENSTNEAEGYYYKQLKEPAKIMYDAIMSNIDGLKNGDEIIKFPGTISDSIKREGNEEKNYFQTAWDAVSLENLDLFYVDTKNLSLETKKWSLLSYKSYEFTLKPYEGKKYYTPYFSSRFEIENALAQVDEVVNNVLSGINENDTPYNKIKYVHDWIVDNFEYDTLNSENNSNIYGAFVNKSVVCEGYAEAFKYMLDKLDIPCVLVYGDGIDGEGKREAHAWNYVKMPDEKWYAVDVTWDDPIYIGVSKWFTNKSSNKYDNFLKGSISFSKSHISSGDVSGTGQDFKYPELSETDYK